MATEIIPERIPLNFFRRVKTTANTFNRSVYTTPSKRAAVIISALATNTQAVPRTVSAFLSNSLEPGIVHALISDFEIPPNDSVNLVINKFVITEGDDFIVRANAESSVNITLAILETYNVP